MELTGKKIGGLRKVLWFSRLGGLQLIPVRLTNDWIMS